MLSDDERHDKLLKLRVKLAKECSNPIEVSVKKKKHSGISLAKGTIHGREIVIPDVSVLLSEFKTDETIQSSKQKDNISYQGRVDKKYFEGRKNLSKEYNTDMGDVLNSIETPNKNLFKKYMTNLQSSTAPYQRVDRLKEVLERYKVDPIPALSPAARWYGLLDSEHYKNPVPGGSDFVPQSPTRISSTETDRPAVAIPGAHDTDSFVVIPIATSDSRPIRFGSKRWSDMVHGSTPLPTPEKSNKILTNIQRAWTDQV